MDYRSDRSSAPADTFRPSASASASSSSTPALPRQRWSQLTSPPVADSIGPSHQAHPCRYDSTTPLDDSARAHRTTALRQLNGNPKPLLWKNRPSNHSSNSRSSTLASQPVLVRSYSGGPDETSEFPKMPSRRSFLFMGSSSPPRRAGPGLPSEQEFSIDGILRAIEPNIRGTLESIGEICGRSKLSLANEYGSHIAPLGEIRAPPGGLVTVEEASPNHDQHVNNHVVIYDDETNTAADGREYTSFPLYGYVEARQAAAHHAYQLAGGDAASVQVQPDTPRSYAFHPSTLDPVHSAGPPQLVTREFLSQPRSSGRALLAKSPQSRTDDQMKTISTPPLVSEVLLDAQADGHAEAQGSLPGPQPVPRTRNINGDLAQNLWTSSAKPDPSVLTDVQALFGWLRNSAQDGGNYQTAEARLRATLEHQRERDVVN